MRQVVESMHIIMLAKMDWFIHTSHKHHWKLQMVLVLFALSMGLTTNLIVDRTAAICPGFCLFEMECLTLPLFACHVIVVCCVCGRSLDFNLHLFAIAVVFVFASSLLTPAYSHLSIHACVHVFARAREAYDGLLTIWRVCNNTITFCVHFDCSDLRTIMRMDVLYGCR